MMDPGPGTQVPCRGWLAVFTVTAFSAILDTLGISVRTGQMWGVTPPASPEVVAVSRAFA
jgi:hypothetical protein